MKTKLMVAALALGVLGACSGASRDIPPPSLAGVEVTRAGLAKQLFGNKARPAALPTAPYGFYSKGCIAGAVELPETGPTWQAMRLSRNRNWGHPETIDFLKTLSRKAAALPGSNGLYIGDISQPAGGPMLTGHASHQIGLDADIWLMPASLGLDRQQRENISAVSMRRANGAYVNEKWSRYQQEVVKAAAKDPRVERIFIFPGAKVQMCDTETGDRSWLRKVRPWYGHHYHFHVRLKCPGNAPGCVAQDPPPPGDGCADARQWQRNILNPPPPDPNAPKPKPKRELTMADLPQSCQAVLAR
ncbi:penicillin-insensitive murein endopeptidase [Palleronia caenipelagi]|uniref:Penicillin-insensitive murein endopeptidase n=1 Tax=Palleronia caenipelagi TaxID=2489174 RepID=A0A547Q2M5_9RHOB|nr:penicillin-insensitive murein endopeptidase [Palleronia caenipelagi]TRD20645.1 penicillin-insensitive murein endopeptidase [Palleronia caenipelagi]